MWRKQILSTAYSQSRGSSNVAYFHMKFETTKLSLLLSPSLSLVSNRCQSELTPNSFLLLLVLTFNRSLLKRTKRNVKIDLTRTRLKWVSGFVCAEDFPIKSIPRWVIAKSQFIGTNMIGIFHRNRMSVGIFLFEWVRSKHLKWMIRGKCETCIASSACQAQYEQRKKSRTAKKKKKERRQCKLQEKMTAQRAHCARKQTNSHIHILHFATMPIWSIRAGRQPNASRTRLKMKWKQEKEEINASSSTSPSSSVSRNKFVYNVRAFSILFNQYEPSSI